MESTKYFKRLLVLETRYKSRYIKFTNPNQPTKLILEKTRCCYPPNKIRAPSTISILMQLGPSPYQRVNIKIINAHAVSSGKIAMDKLLLMKISHTVGYLYAKIKQIPERQTLKQLAIIQYHSIPDPTGSENV